MNVHITEKEKDHYRKIMSTTPSIRAMLNRVLIVPVIKAKEKIEDMSIPGLEMSGIGLVKRGNLFILEKSEKTLEENEVIKGVVKSVGPTRDGRTPCVSNGDLVLILSTGFETIIKIDDLDYFVYSEMDIVAKYNMKPFTDETIYDNKSMD